MKGESIKLDKEDIMKFWNDSLVQISMKLLSNYLLSKETRELFNTVGLPAKCEFLKDLNLSFYDDFEQIRLNDHHYLVFGDDYGTKLCIDDKTDQVVSVDIEGNMKIRLINSNIASFLVFLQLFFTQRTKLVQADDQEATAIVKSIKHSFNSVDYAALLEEDNWWTIILEQVEQGLL